jgi:hypothetical protein
MAQCRAYMLFDYEQADLYFLVARKHPPTGWCLTIVFSFIYINAALNDALNGVLRANGPNNTLQNTCLGYSSV